MIHPWEYFLARKLMKNAGVDWHGLPPLPTEDFHKLEIPGLAVAIGAPEAFARTAHRWVDDVLNYAEDVANLAGTRLLLPADPAQEIEQWVNPGGTKRWGDRAFDTFVDVPLRVPYLPYLPHDLFEATRSASRNMPALIQRWKNAIAAALPNVSPELYDYLLERARGFGPGATINPRILAPTGVQPYGLWDDPPLIHLHFVPELASNLIHELGHASIPSFAVAANYPYARRMHSEIANIGAVHHVLPVLIEALRIRLGESPFTAQAVGQTLDQLLGTHKYYLDQLKLSPARRPAQVPELATDEFADLALKSLSQLDTLDDQWGRAVRAYASEHLSGQPPEDPRISALRIKLQNMLLYLAASGIAGRPTGEVDFAQLLHTLDWAHRQIGTPIGKSQIMELLGTALRGPKSKEELARFLELIKGRVPKVEKSPSYQWIRAQLDEATKSPEFFEKLFKYPEVKTIPRLSLQRPGNPWY
jgi:hypothetical protein